MQGYQLTFFTQQNRSHGGKPLVRWLMDMAQDLGVAGATLTAASEGFGRHHHLHSAHFIELADQPLILTMVVTAEDAGRIFALLKQEQINVFYTKAPVEFGMSAES
jgi:PII-like signaling protein